MRQDVELRKPLLLIRIMDHSFGAQILLQCNTTMKFGTIQLRVKRPRPTANEPHIYQKYRVYWGHRPTHAAHALLRVTVYSRGLKSTKSERHKYCNSIGKYTERERERNSATTLVTTTTVIRRQACTSNTVTDTSQNLPK